MVWSCIPFIRSGQNHLARHNERGKKTRQNGQAWSSANPRGQWRQGKMKKTGCKIICGAPTTLAVKELMMMMMMKCGCFRLAGGKKSWMKWNGRNFFTFTYPLIARVVLGTLYALVSVLQKLGEQKSRDPGGRWSTQSYSLTCWRGRRENRWQV